MAIAYECECVLAAHISILHALRTNMPDRDKFEDACCIFMSFYMLICSNI